MRLRKNRKVVKCRKGSLCQASLVTIRRCNQRSRRTAQIDGGSYAEEGFLIGDDWVCTREDGHTGPHVACGMFDHNFVIWYSVE